VKQVFEFLKSAQKTIETLWKL